MIYSFDAVQISVGGPHVVIDRAEHDCADLSEAMVKAQGLWLQGRLPGVDRTPFAVIVYDEDGAEVERYDQTSEPRA